VTRLALGLIAAALVIARPASAHDVRGEVALLDIGEHAVDLELQVPVRQLEAARGAPLGADPAAAVRAEQTALRADAAARIGATSRAGLPFTVAIRSITVERIGDGDVVVVRAHLEAPDGDARWFVLRDDLVLGRVVTDTVYAFVRTDLANGIVDQAPRLIGYLHYQARALIVDRGAGSRLHSFTTVFRLGLAHIASGTDHLLFLLVLVIPAPLAASGGRWRRRRATWASCVAVLQIATAFTIGHSITLIAGAIHGAVLPPKVVEVGIAVSIAVAALHALRPLFPGGERVVAAGFGLIHGLAFASSLAGIGVDRPSLVIGVLGFNLGVEAMQLAILVVTVPWLLVLARHPAYRAVRVAAAGFAGIAAVGWILDRTGALTSPVPRLVERAAASAGWVVVGLALATIASELVRTRALRAPRW
jgi:hypothetical protein